MVIFSHFTGKNGLINLFFVLKKLINHTEKVDSFTRKVDYIPEKVDTPAKSVLYKFGSGCERCDRPSALKLGLLMNPDDLFLCSKLYKVIIIMISRKI